MTYENIRKLLQTRMGFDDAVIGEKPLERVIAKRVNAGSWTDEATYLRDLLNSAEELKQLIGELVIPETWFFRDLKPFLYLTQLIREQKLKPAAGPLRFLSMPCSSGEEPYSIAMTLLGAGLSREMFQIDAIDVSESAISKAKLGQYGKNSFRVQTHLLKPGFVKEECAKFTLSPQVLSSVSFHCENILERESILAHGTYDVVFCKNLLIYLNEEARNKVISTLSALTKEGSLLFCGHSEVLLYSETDFRMMSVPGAFVCEKRTQPPAPKIKTQKLPLSPVSEAKNVFQQAPQTPEKFESEPARFARIQELANNGDFEQAATLCEEILKKDRLSAQAYGILGEICLAQNKLTEAEEHLRKSVYLKPDHYNSLLHLAMLYSSLGDDTKAALYADRARRLEADIQHQTAEAIE